MRFSRKNKLFKGVTQSLGDHTEPAEILEILVNGIASVLTPRGCSGYLVDTRTFEIQMMAASGQIEDPFFFRGILFENKPRAHTDWRRIVIKDFLGATVSVFEIPLTITPELSVVLSIFLAEEKELGNEGIDLVIALGERCAEALKRTLIDARQTASENRTVVQGLSLSLRDKDPITYGHSLKVAEYSRLTAEALGMNLKEAERLYQAGLLHDIGKLRLSRDLLHNLGQLSAEEFDIVKYHPLIGEKILRQFPFLADILPAVLHHHERFDGSGYPEGLSGNQIPLGARIIAVCDAFDAMISERPHMGRMDPAEARIQLKSNAGLLYDPRVVNAFMKAGQAHPEALAPYKIPAALKDADGEIVITSDRQTLISRGRLKYMGYLGECYHFKMIEGS
ncbi:MAG: HD domain-containing protein [Desulfobacterales bacterium]|nr:HD domain-containing protein [Desulfobacterales bacterium]